MRIVPFTLILLLAGIGGPVAAPYDMAVQPETAPARGEVQAAPKISSQKESQPPAKPSSETQGRRQSEPPNGTTKAPAAAVEGTPAVQPPSLVQGNAAAEPQRYSFHRLKDDLLRLDSRTGEVAQCGLHATGWSCKAVPDERAALENEIARLQHENATLKSSLLTRGIELPNGIKTDAPSAKDGALITRVPQAAPAPKPPHTSTFDRAIEVAKDIWGRLLEMIVELQRHVQGKI